MLRGGSMTALGVRGLKPPEIQRMDLNFPRNELAVDRISEVSSRALTPKEKILPDRNGRKSLKLRETFPCAYNPLCFLLDASTCCWTLCWTNDGDAGCISGGDRPTVCDESCPTLMPPYYVEKGLVGLLDCCTYPSYEFRKKAAEKFKASQQLDPELEQIKPMKREMEILNKIEEETSDASSEDLSLSFQNNLSEPEKSGRDLGQNELSLGEDGLI